MRLARFTLLALWPVLALVACANAPAPSATPIPSAAGSAEAGAPSNNVQISAHGVMFEQASVDVPAGKAFKIDFDNKDPSTPHNIVIHMGDANGPVVFEGETVTGVVIKTYDVPALDAGTYAFVCSIHPTPMVGVLTAK